MTCNMHPELHIFQDSHDRDLIKQNVNYVPVFSNPLRQWMLKLFESIQINKIEKYVILKLTAFFQGSRESIWQ